MKKDARGTKLTCQVEECGSRFYDLNREPPICPICGATYVIVQPEDVVPETPEETKPESSGAEEGAAATEKDGESEAIDEIADIETDDALSDDDDESDVFLESDEDEEGGNVSDLVGGVKPTKQES